MADDATLPAAVITGLAVGIGFVVVFSIFFTPSLMDRNGSDSAVPTESAVGPTVQDIVKATPASPPAIFSKGEAPQVVSGVVLGKMAEAVKGTKTDPANDLGTVKDNIGTVTLTIYNATTAGKDLIAATLKNDGSSPILINSFHLAGYSHCSFGVDCNAESLYRPVISGPEDVVKPLINTTTSLGPGEAVTAQIVPDLQQDGYSASACYAYDLNDYSTFYCITISPIVWLRS